MGSKFSYWSGMNVWTTSNSQMPGGNIHQSVFARRLPTDTYVRSVWWATVGYSSDGTGGVPGWWNAASVIFTLDFDVLGSGGANPGLQTGEPPNRLGFMALRPQLFATPGFTGLYQVAWEGAPDGLELGQSRRKGNGEQMPCVTAQLNCRDQNGFFNGTTEPSYILRCTISGRVLWESDQEFG
jgi:hypothetical protein